MCFLFCLAFAIFYDGLVWSGLVRLIESLKINDGAELCPNKCIIHSRHGKVIVRNVKGRTVLVCSDHFGTLLSFTVFLFSQNVQRPI